MYTSLPQCYIAHEKGPAEMWKTLRNSIAKLPLVVVGAIELGQSEKSIVGNEGWNEGRSSGIHFGVVWWMVRYGERCVVE